MNNLAFRGVTEGNIEDVAEKVTKTIKEVGFGVLTRINFDEKIKGGTGNTINPCIILGACNPALAYEAYKQTTDTALLVPCNLVLTEIEKNKIRVEFMKPSVMLKNLENLKDNGQICEIENKLHQILKDAHFVD